MSPARPQIAVVVPSHDRTIRLRWLLNALEEQTLAHERFEVIVCHDCSDMRTVELLDHHPLAAEGVLRHVALAPGKRPPGLQRNAALELVQAPLVLFTDDDCRPPPNWLERALAASERNPGAIVQGRTAPDPDELSIAYHVPHTRSQRIDPPVIWAQTCNILYPRALLIRLGGFDEHMEAGEDTDLCLRARADGNPYVGAPEMLTYHAVHALGLLGSLRTLPRWRHVAGLAKRHPTVRKHFSARIFWRESHGLLLLAIAGAGCARAHPVLALLVLPWAVHSAPSYGNSVRGRVRAVSELPAVALLDLAELGVMAAGSIRYRTLLL